MKMLLHISILFFFYNNPKRPGSCFFCKYLHDPPSNLYFKIVIHVVNIYFYVAGYSTSCTVSFIAVSVSVSVSVIVSGIGIGIVIGSYLCGLS